MSTRFPRVTIPNSEVRILPSSHVHQDFQILVALPHGYADTGRAFPVLYLLDANLNFGTVTETVRLLSVFQQLPEMIVAGIGYPVDGIFETSRFRTRDLTPTEVEGWDERARDLPAVPEAAGSGGAPAFLRFLREELVPFINASYRADGGDQALFGHSFGGLFALFVLFHEPGTLNRYIISSPAIWWDEGVIFSHEATCAATNSDLPARVFMSAGSLEGAPDAGSLMMRLANTLQGRNYAGLELTTHVFEEETHLSVVPATISRGLRVVFR
jgi:predicted alpha/beta superfamily hydrolase